MPQSEERPQPALPGATESLDGISLSLSSAAHTWALSDFHDSLGYASTGNQIADYNAGARNVGEVCVTCPPKTGPADM